MFFLLTNLAKFKNTTKILGQKIILTEKTYIFAQETI